MILIEVFIRLLNLMEVYQVLKEIGIALGIAALIILLFQGFNITPILFLGAILYFMNNMFFKNNLKNDKKNKTKVIPKILFDDIGGQKTAKAELVEALDFIKNVENVKSMGIRPIKGILLTGPPGTGKTLMAKAAARYTDSVFTGVSGSEFIEMYAGLGAKRIRELFENAREKAKKSNKNSAIIFIDEIDILGGKRGKVTSHLEYDQTLNQLLVELDGLSINDNVQLLVVAATNRKDILDNALLRPGRFDRIVNVGLPAKEGRLEILKIHTTGKPLANNIDLDQIASETFMFSGAHLENLTNEAAILAMRDKSKKIEQKHFSEAIDKVMMGEKLSRKPKEDELKRIAIHEIGHGFVSELLRPGSVSTVTITSRGKALGYVRHNNKEDFYLQTEDYLEEQISISVAGAAAEKLILNSKSTGAINDFEKALEMVDRMIFSGMSELGVVRKDKIPEKIYFSEQKRILDKIIDRVKTILSSNKNMLIEISEILVKKEQISGEEIRDMINTEKTKVLSN